MCRVVWPATTEAVLSMFLGSSRECDNTHLEENEFMQKHSFAHVGHRDTSHDHERPQKETLTPSFCHESFTCCLFPPIAKAILCPHQSPIAGPLRRRRHIGPRHSKQRSTWYVPFQPTHLFPWSSSHGRPSRCRPTLSEYLGMVLCSG